MIIEITPQSNLHSETFKVGDEAVRTRDARHGGDPLPSKISGAGDHRAVETDQLRHLMDGVKNRRLRAGELSDRIFKRATIERLIAARDDHRVGAAHRGDRFAQSSGSEASTNNKFKSRASRRC